MYRQKLILRLCFLILASPCFLLAQIPKLMMPLGHTDGVMVAKFSPDGKYVVTGAADKTAKVWETATGKKIQNLGGGKGDINTIAFSNDGKFVAIGEDSTVTLWETGSYTKVKVIEAVIKAVFSPDKKSLFLIDFAGTIKKFDLASMKITASYPDSISYRSFDCSEDAKYFCGAGDSTLVIRSIVSGNIVYKGTLTGAPSACFFTKDGRFLFVLAPRNSFKIDLAGFSRSNLALGNVDAMYLSNNRKYLLSLDGMIPYTTSRLWDVEQYKEMISSESYKKFTDSIQSEWGDTVIVHNPELPFSFPDFLYYRSVSISNDARYLKLGRIIWNVRNPVASYEIEEDNLRSADFTRDGNFVLVQLKPGVVSLWDIALKKEVQRYQNNADNIHSVTISPDGNAFMIYGFDSTVKVCNTLTGKKNFLLQGHHDRVVTATYNDSATLILTNSLDSTARLWDARSGALLHVYPQQFPETNPAIFDEEGKVHLTVVEYDQVDWYDPESGEVKGVIAIPKPYGREHLYRMLFNSNVYARSGDYHAKNIYETDTLVLQYRNEMLDSSIVLFHESIGVLAKNRWGGKQITGVWFSPGTKYLLITDNNSMVHLFSMKQRKVTASVPGEGVTFSGDGKYFMTANQGECWVYDLERIKLLYRYISVDENNYLALDSANRYDGTEGARKLLYYTCGKEVIDLEQFKDLSWEPGLIGKIMGVSKEPITAKKLSEINICNFTPEVQELEMSDGAYRYKVTPRNGGLGEVQLYVNGKLVKRYDPLILTKVENYYLLKINPELVEDYFVTGGENKVEVKATTRTGNMQSRGAVILAAPVMNSRPNPNMYLISIGVSKYKGDGLRLTYASKDANDFSGAVAASARKLLNTDGKDHVKSFLFNTDAEGQRWPLKKSIQHIFDSIANIAKADDILVVFFAGHGVVQSGQKNFYLVTAEATSFEQVTTLASEVAISTEELNLWMQRIKANKQILVLDACNSGKAAKNLQELIAKRDVPADQQRALEDLKDKTGTYILAASAEGQSAYETSLYGQGLLTYCLLSGIKLGDGLRENKYIDVTQWFSTASSNVKILARDIGGRQDPQMIGSATFDVGMVDAEVVDGIKLSIKKKIFCRSKFIENEDLLNDDIDLTGLVNKELNNLSSRGKESPLAYAADNTLPESYSVRGKYEINEHTITVKFSLFKGQKERIQTFTLTGTLDQKESLAIKIVETVGHYLDN